MTAMSNNKGDATPDVREALAELVEIFGNFPADLSDRATRAVLAGRAALTAPALARPTDTYVAAYECRECGHTGINDSHDKDAACGYPCGWSGPSPKEDKCPGCHREGTMCTACPKCSGYYSVIAETHLPGPALAPVQPAITVYELSRELGVKALAIMQFIKAEIDEDVTLNQAVSAFIADVVRQHFAAPVQPAEGAPSEPETALVNGVRLPILTRHSTSLHCAAPQPEVQSAEPKCQPDGLMFDALGAPRVRYVRVSLDRSHCVMTVAEAEQYKRDCLEHGDKSAYTYTDTYLSEREFNDLPEHDGF